MSSTLAIRVLVVVAHPDDAEFWVGGTIARWCAEGVEVTYLVLTDGDAGGAADRRDRAALTEERRQEQEAAARLLGVRAVRFLGWHEGTFAQSMGRRREIVRAVREFRPHRVVTWTPEWNWNRFRSSCHVDHRATGELTLTSVYPDSGNPHAHADLAENEGLEPWTVGDIWLINGRETNTYVDVTEYFDRKLEALRAHSTQSQRGKMVEKMRAWMAPNAAAAGLPDDRYAEAFQVVVNE